MCYVFPSLNNLLMEQNLSNILAELSWFQTGNCTSRFKCQTVKGLNNLSEKKTRAMLLRPK